MQFSLRTLIAMVVLAALLTSGILLNRQLNGLKAEAKRNQSEIDDLNFELDDVAVIEESIKRYNKFFDKRRDEIGIAKEKYLELAQSMRPLKFVDESNKGAFVEVPDTSWLRKSDFERKAWRVFVPQSKAGTTSRLALDFLPLFKTASSENPISGSQPFESAKILKDSKQFRTDSMLPAKSKRFDLPAGESKVYFDTKRGSEGVTISILVNDTCVHRLRCSSNDVTTSPTFPVAQQDFDPDKPKILFSYGLYNGSAFPEQERCWLRILPPKMAGTEDVN